MDMRAKLRKAAGLFVNLPDEEPSARDEEREMPAPRTVEQLARDTAGPNLDEIHFSAASGALPVMAQGAVDFAQIYAQAGLPETPFTAEEMVGMLHSLPAELPLAMKRQTVNVTLNAMGKSIGATPETVVLDASRKLAALTAYTDGLAQQTTHLISTTEQEIADLQAQIEAKRQVIVAGQENLANALQACHAESDRIDDVLEFFSLDVPPSRHSIPAAATM